MQILEIARKKRSPKPQYEDLPVKYDYEDDLLAKRIEDPNF